MPPRKRTAPKPQPDEDQTGTGPEDDEQSTTPPGDSPDTPDAADDSSGSSDGPDGGDTPPATPKGDGKTGPEGETPPKSDLQRVDQPCTECMPNGWPEGAFSVGCTHGTWVRDVK
ncbi:hypothetical protein [Streptomyces sp. NPDC019937]|uniref:hypothetical protein n=1 Tax=Streptomyces sp. NPDC019937 TaxID=3154787 RepID=UPI0033F79024